LRIRQVPELHFVYDDSVERGIRLSHLIDEAVASDGALDADPGPARTDE
jgi:ribosome-binding factor A